MYVLLSECLMLVRKERSTNALQADAISARKFSDKKFQRIPPNPDHYRNLETGTTLGHPSHCLHSVSDLPVCTWPAVVKQAPKTWPHSCCGVITSFGPHIRRHRDKSGCEDICSQLFFVASSMRKLPQRLHEFLSLRPTKWLNRR